MELRKLAKRAKWLLILLLLLSAGFWAWHIYCGGVSHREIKDAVQEESRAVQSSVNSRCDAIERKLDRIESKLDRLIEMATPRLPDGMKAAGQ